jgi:hypothetical protein
MKGKRDLAGGMGVVFVPVSFSSHNKILRICFLVYKAHEKFNKK